jgi:hypothetical protein
MSGDPVTYPFVVVLRNTHAHSVRRIGALAGTFAILILAWKAQEEGWRYYALILAVVSALFIRNLVRTRRDRTVTHWPVLMIAGMSLLPATPYVWAGLVLLVMAAMESRALRPQEIGFAEDHIEMTGASRKRIEWSSLSNVMLKDGLLTMDYRDNRLFQKEVDDLDDEEYEGSEDEFNAFCRAQLSRHAANAQ